MDILACDSELQGQDTGRRATKLTHEEKAQLRRFNTALLILTTNELTDPIKGSEKKINFFCNHPLLYILAINVWKLLKITELKTNLAIVSYDEYDTSTYYCLFILA